MKTDTELRHEGIRTLLATLGDLDTERFLALLQREKFDYSEWRTGEWQQASVSELAAKARAIRLSKTT